MKKSIALLCTMSMALSLAACNSPAAEKTETTAAPAETAEVKTEQAADPGDAGFTEFPIFEDEEVSFMNVSAVYFQPVPMSNGNENIEDFNIHLECDVSALENKLGYGTGDWVPYLTVDYKVVGDNGAGDVAAQGTFMVMSASDGPHYGANIKLDKADTYEVTFTFHSPEENGYLVHTDAETGPGGTFDEYFKDGNLTVTVGGWEYTPQEWN
ncbi:MAG: iron transporter [Ruminococcus sp.]|nr:iron transporter [Ruminococcus sp.]MBQ5316654.1 iron transporter [Oscillospiraceae bacterium]